MRLTLSRIVTLLLLPAAVGIALPSASQTVSIIFSFSGQASSGYPVFVVPAQGRDGKFYGTAYGPSGSGGSVFRVTSAGLENQIYALGSDGTGPERGLTLGTDGNFYGTTSLGGASNNGVLFKVSPNGTYTALHEFAGGTDGANPTAPPIVASDGNLYGS